MSDTFSITQLVTIAVFLSVLIGIMVLVRRYKEPLAKQLGGQRRIKLMEDTPIGANERAKLVQVDGQTFLIVSAKNQSPVVVPFDTFEAFDSDATSSAKSASKSASNFASNFASQSASNTTFLEAMKQARLRNPNLGLDQS
ncbi:MAG: FliO/MopB family protein [Alphaproteobacteria bacterium]|nr:FliO/MopB family protein [Alphaproteobacteria bacterium]